MFFYLSINNAKKEVKNLIIKELKKYKEEFNFKTITYSFSINKDHLLIDGNLDRKLIRTLKWIDDISDKAIRHLNEEFGITISLNLKKLLKDQNNINDIKILFNNVKLKNILKELDDILLNVKSFDNKVIFKFDFCSTFKESKTINLKTENGIMKLKTFSVPSHNKIFTVGWVGELKDNINLRIHHMCETSEIFNSIHCDCKIQLNNFKKIMFSEGGIIVYAHEEGRGLGLENKINAYYNTEKLGLDTVEAMVKEVGKEENRQFDMAAEVVRKMGIKSVKIWTNNPLKIYPLEDRGIKVLRQETWEKAYSKEQKKYILTKIEKMGHITWK